MTEKATTSTTRVSRNDVRARILRIPPDIRESNPTSDTILLALGSQVLADIPYDAGRTYVARGISDFYRSCGLLRRSPAGHRQAREGAVTWTSYQNGYKATAEPLPHSAWEDIPSPPPDIEASQLALGVDEDGVETEAPGENFEEAQPFDPAKVDVELRPMTIQLLLTRLKNDEIDLRPSFQRGEVWKLRAKSRLIESLLIRIPLPAFYMDGTNEDKWLVVDGLQRLSTIRDFAITKSLALSDLEFLTEHEGARFDELPRRLQRRIEEAQVTVYVIRPGTPQNVKFNIFRRINTGGMPLSPQEIRHALNQGPAADLLEELADSNVFRSAISNGINSKRMTDREFILRFISFWRAGPTPVVKEELDLFLNRTMEEINKLSKREIQTLKQRFFLAMSRAEAIFETDAFRKRYSLHDGRRPLNKALFETWSVHLASLDDKNAQTLIDRRNEVKAEFCKAMNDREFDQAISQGTGDPRKIEFRYRRIGDLIQGVLDNGKHD